MLPGGKMPANLQFLLMGVALGPATPATVPPALPTSVAAGLELLPDVEYPAVFMMQNLPADNDPGQKLLCFYDSGCGGAGLSDRAYKLLKTATVRAGPTVLDVAGGKSIEIPYGDERFTLELANGRQAATITGLRMPYITKIGRAHV